MESPLLFVLFFLVVVDFALVFRRFLLSPLLLQLTLLSDLIVVDGCDGVEMMAN